MSRQASARFTIKKWDETPYMELASGSKFTHATVQYAYTGEMNGNSSMEYTMFYRPDGTGTYVGVEHFIGSVADLTGSLVFEHSGIFDKDGVQGACFVVVNSGTDALAGIHGQGMVDLIGHADDYPFELTYVVV